MPWFEVGIDEPIIRTEYVLVEADGEEDAMDVVDAAMTRGTVLPVSRVKEVSDSDNGGIDPDDVHLLDDLAVHKLRQERPDLAPLRQERSA